MATKKRHRTGRGRLRAAKGHTAHLLTTGVNEATRWPTETYLVDPPGQPGMGTERLTLFKDGGKWHAWTGNILRPAERARAKAFARSRNRRKES